MDDQKEPVGSPFLTPEEQDVIKAIRARGARVIVLTPAEFDFAGDIFSSRDVEAAVEQISASIRHLREAVAETSYGRFLLTVKALDIQCDHRKDGILVSMMIGKSKE